MARTMPGPKGGGRWREGDPTQEWHLCPDAFRPASPGLLHCEEKRISLSLSVSVASQSAWPKPSRLSEQVSPWLCSGLLRGFNGVLRMGDLPNARLKSHPATVPELPGLGLSGPAGALLLPVGQIMAGVYALSFCHSKLYLCKSFWATQRMWRSAQESWFTGVAESELQTVGEGVQGKVGWAG